MRDKLLTDLYRAYYDARKNKRGTHTQLEFELNLERNVVELYKEIKERRYRPSSSICFIIEKPVKREVFASNFRDRVVHHLYFNYVSQIFERSFIYDSYSCRKGKGTLFGIERLEHHLRSATENYQKEAWVLKMDIQGYFMSINRERLRIAVESTLNRWWHKKGPDGREWGEIIDKELVLWLTKVITLKDPLENCRIKGSSKDWEGLPDSKSLRKSPTGVGLPIGDLTSQLFSNVFMNELDHYVKRVLKFKHYGRYVDDFYIISQDKEQLKSSIEPIRKRLVEMGLVLHPRKTKLMAVHCGVQFLGAEVKPRCRKVTHRTLRNYKRHLHNFEQWCAEGNLDETRKLQVRSTMNSYLGYFTHFKMKKVLEESLKKSPLLNYFSLHENRRLEVI